MNTMTKHYIHDKRGDDVNCIFNGKTTSLPLIEVDADNLKAIRAASLFQTFHLFLTQENARNWLFTAVNRFPLLSDHVRDMAVASAKERNAKKSTAGIQYDEMLDTYIDNIQPSMRKDARLILDTLRTLALIDFTLIDTVAPNELIIVGDGSEDHEAITEVSDEDITDQMIQTDKQIRKELTEIRAYVENGLRVPKLQKRHALNHQKTHGSVYLDVIDTLTKQINNKQTSKEDRRDCELKLKTVKEIEMQSKKEVPVAFLTDEIVKETVESFSAHVVRDVSGGDFATSHTKGTYVALQDYLLSAVNPASIKDRIFIHEDAQAFMWVQSDAKESMENIIRYHLKDNTKPILKDIQERTKRLKYKNLPIPIRPRTTLKVSMYMHHDAQEEKEKALKMGHLRSHQDAKITLIAYDHIISMMNVQQLNGDLLMDTPLTKHELVLADEPIKRLLEGIDFVAEKERPLITQLAFMSYIMINRLTKEIKTYENQTDEDSEDIREELINAQQDIKKEQAAHAKTKIQLTHEQERYQRASKDLARYDQTLQKNKDMQDEINFLRNALARATNTLDETPVVNLATNDPVCVESYLNEKDVVIIGGHDAWVRHMQERLPLAYVESTDALHKTLKQVNTADFIVVNASIMNHSMYGNIQNAIKSTGRDIPLLYINEQVSNVNRSLLIIEQELQLKVDDYPTYAHAYSTTKG